MGEFCPLINAVCVRDKCIAFEKRVVKWVMYNKEMHNEMQIWEHKEYDSSLLRLGLLEIEHISDEKCVHSLYREHEHRCSHFNKPLNPHVR